MQTLRKVCMLVLISFYQPCLGLARITHESLPINIVSANIRDKDIRSSKTLPIIIEYRIDRAKVLPIIIDGDKISDIGDFEYSQQP